MLSTRAPLQGEVQPGPHGALEPVVLDVGDDPDDGDPGGFVVGLPRIRRPTGSATLGQNVRANISLTTTTPPSLGSYGRSSAGSKNRPRVTRRPIARAYEGEATRTNMTGLSSLADASRDPRPRRSSPSDTRAAGSSPGLLPRHPAAQPSTAQAGPRTRRVPCRLDTWLRAERPRTSARARARSPGRRCGRDRRRDRAAHRTPAATRPTRTRRRPAAPASAGPPARPSSRQSWSAWRRGDRRGARETRAPSRRG